MKVFFLTWGLIILSALFDSYAAFVVKTKFNELGHIDFSSFRSFWSYVVGFIRNPKLLLAVTAFVAAPGLWFLALNRIDLSIGYPILVGFHLLFVLVFGIFALDESFTWNKMIGVALVLSSLYFFYKK
ncbi:MAG: EamA family transporter [Crocinitomicaceae bacterium]|nr:EamA family transporter [Crocinitomicaceae bacterium]